MPEMSEKKPERMEMGDPKKMQGMPGKGASEVAEVIAQKWDDQKQTLERAMVQRPTAEVDVNYDALLANRRTLDDPELFLVPPGETVLIRLVAAASSTNFYVDTGALEAEILAVDGQAVQPLKGNFFNWAPHSASI